MKFNSEPSESQKFVEIKFVSIDSEIRVPDIPFKVLTSHKCDDLNLLLNKTAAASDAQWKDRNFEFLVGDTFLRTSLEEFIEEYEVGTEAVVIVNCLIKDKRQKPVHDIQDPDCVSSARNCNEHIFSTTYGGDIVIVDKKGKETKLATSSADGLLKCSSIVTKPTRNRDQKDLLKDITTFSFFGNTKYTKAPDSTKSYSNTERSAELQLENLRISPKKSSKRTLADCGGGYRRRSQSLCTFKYSPQLELVIRKGCLPLEYVKRAQQCDKTVRNEFTGYSSFCYLIMDPVLLGKKVEKLTLKAFIEAIFYVGKGTKNRPLHHFIETRNERKKRSEKLESCNKLGRISDLWSAGYAVAVHEFSSLASEKEALAKEASIIDAIGLTSLSNKKAGEYHGSTKDWDIATRAIYGTFLLERALATMKLEGVRYIAEEHLPEK